MPDIAWIAADWGTSRLRVWAMDAEDAVVDHRASDQGMGILAPDAFEPALLSLVGDWLTARTPVIACGMVGARQGWVEAPYGAVPCAPLGQGRFQPAPCTDPRLEMRIIPGLMQARPADVMRGEETQIAGLLAAEPAFSGTLCLPGTHTKWADIAHGHVTRFTSCMTGEVFALLADRSVLRHSVGGAALDRAAFADALDDALAAGASLLPALFSIRAEDLLHGTAPAIARARLSARLIGAEVAAMAQGTENVTLLGDPALADLYALALDRAGIPVRRVDAEGMTLRGLVAARALMQGTPA